ncbi:PfkB family carbohydrate kinase [Microbulbifer rhizosphaerae]|uniref:Fructokinase n=1 Tax=Microbulbifer rhizosphaerae TaxID=1562603 RepID=A0A7W4WEK7_9GAMM|nr:PfkB family carbohydrate kinase [Microbulbifer rhizosphaerae]MBB3062302.1 fructokinase [Microbulbifer rhizosphaerae]
MSELRVSVFGEALIDLIETPGGYFEPHVGGSPFNVCRGFARMGLACDYLAPISSDRMGERIAAAALAESINIGRVAHSPRPTSLALVSIGKDGQPNYRLYREGVADLDIDTEALVEAVHPQCRLFHSGSLALVAEMEATLAEVFARLHARGVPVSIDANLRSGVARDTDAYVAAVKRLIGCADILKVSDEDLQLLGVREPLRFCEALLRDGRTRLVAFTEGALGATLISRRGRVQQPAAVPEVLGDAVGAGDTFFAVLLSHLVRNDLLLNSDAALDSAALEAALAFAQQAASINVSRRGCNPPTLGEVQSALAAEKV